ncbi:MAG: hypothetical protein JXA99_14460 [Candidatus Lokiarchaeota archaeon]|nr:hypothetical protein [Candidatus Lokiarchaeota archaeon]
MTQVKIERENLTQLIDFKLNQLRKEIELILNKWNYPFSDKFLDDAKSGKISEAEEDAIILKNIEDEIRNLENQMKNWLNQ